MKPEDFLPNLIATIHQGVIRGNKSRSKFIKAGSIVDYIDIVDLKNEQIKTIYGPIDEFPDVKISQSRGFQMPNYNINNFDQLIFRFLCRGGVFFCAISREELSADK
jgi:hypothetical protein